MLKLQNILWIYLSFFFSVAFAQDYSVRLTRLSTEEGLAQGHVNSMLLDRDGYLWLATEGGLNRYDGAQIINIKGPQDAFLDNKKFNYVFQDSNGLIWINADDSGLFTLDLNTNEYRKHLDGRSLTRPVATTYVSQIIEQDNNQFWLAVGPELLLYHADSGQIEHKFDLGGEDHYIRRILLHKQHMYIATTLALYVLDITTGQYKSISHNPSDALNADQNNIKELYVSDNELWIGTVEGLYSLGINNMADFIDGNSAQDKPLLRLKDRNIWRIQAHDTGFYLATDQGLLDYNKKKHQANSLIKFSDDAKFEVNDNNIIDLVIDQQGNFWLASRFNGAFHWNIKSTKFNTIFRKKNAINQPINQPSNQLSNNQTWAVRETDDNILWVGTQNGINKVDLTSSQITSFLMSQQSKFVDTASSIFKILTVGEGLLWLDTGAGDKKLRLFDSNTGELRQPFFANKETQRVMSQPSRGHYIDSQNVMWFSSMEHYYRYDTEKGEVSQLSQLEDKVDPKKIRVFLGPLPERPDTMVLSGSGALWLYDARNDNVRQLFATPDFLPHHNASPDSWVIDKHNIFWLTISGYGLIGIDASTYELKHHYAKGKDKGKKILNNSVYGLQLDQQGDLWMSSNAGLMRMDIDSHNIELFSTSEGLATNEFNGGAGTNAYTKLRDGRLVYASMLGIVVFDPEDFRQLNKQQQEVKITNLALLSRPLEMPLGDLSGSHLQLNYDDIGLAINFSDMNFGSQHKTSYRYHLRGKKTVNYPESSHTEILIPQLQPGNYTFTVVALDPKSGAESLPKSITIAVNYALWASPLARVLYGLIILATILHWWRRNKRHHASLLAAHQNVLISEERFKLALKGSQSGVWDWQAKHDLMFEPRVNELLGHDQVSNALSLAQHLALIHDNDRKDFEHHWTQFLASPQHNFDCTYRMKSKSGQWLWFHDLGMVAETDEQGSATRITGAYTNITEIKANEQQAKLFGEAFQQTRDWVVILDDEQKVIAANQTFRDTFGIKPDSVLPAHGGKVIGISRKKQNNYTRILHRLKAGQHWQGEELVVNKDGQAYPVIISMNAVAGKGNEVAFFVIVLTDITAQKAAENELRHLANYDSLTNLPNRALLLDRIKHAIEHARRNKSTMALFFIDLDRFKQVNDSLGHDMGDQLLIDVAHRLKSVLREADTVARLGGDEFVILLESYGCIDDVSHIAQKIIDKIDQPINLSKGTVSVSPSIGIALYPEDALSHSQLLENADVAMYHAKEMGRNNYQFFTEKMNEQAKAKLDQENKLKQGFIKNEFENFYQPIVDANTNKLKGFELLLRWPSSEGMIPPSDFIPVAEDLGLIVKMTQNAIRQGLIDLCHWHDLGHSPYLSINLSVKDLEQQSLADDIELLVTVSGLPMSLVRFEITESALMVNVDKAVQTMEKLKALGAVLALDDFGTGYSSLKYLKEFPIDIIKIDRSFVKDIGVDKNDEAIINSIIVMANSLGMHCIAEGVETEQQLAFLQQRNCDLIQGFLYSKPVPADQALRLIDTVLPLV